MTELNFKPFNMDVIVQVPDIKETTEFGVIKSESQIEEERRKMDKYLTVLAVSDKCVQTKVGDQILISRGSHPSIEQDGKIYIIVNELHILGKRIENVIEDSSTDATQLDLPLNDTLNKKIE